MIFRIRIKPWAKRVLMSGALAIGCAGAVAEEAVVPASVSLPQDNPYAAAFSAFKGLGKEDRDALNAGTPTSPEAVRAMDEIVASLAAGRRVEPVDWGTDYSKGAATNLEKLMPALPFVRAGIASLNHVSPGERVERLLGVLACGRHVGSEGLLLTFGVQRSTESRVATWLEKHRDQITPEEASQLLAGLETLPAGTTLAHTLMQEKAVFIGGMLRELKEAAELLSARKDDVARGVRMTGIVVEGAATQIGFERDGVGFWLKRGQTREGVTLLEVDPANDSAVLKIKGQTVRLQLSSKRIARIDLSRMDAARNAAPHNSVLNMMEGIEPGTDGAAALRNLEAALTEIGRIYDEARERPEDFADVERVKARTAGLSPLAQHVAEMLPDFVKQEASAAERARRMREMLEEIAGR